MLSLWSGSRGGRWIAGALAVVMTAQPLLADVSTAHLWAERRSASSAPLAPVPPLLPPVVPAAASHRSDLALFNHLVPSAPGRVVRVVADGQSRGAPVVILQDVHRSPEAQKNIADALASLWDA